MSQSSSITAPRPVVLCILDGWGDGPDTDSNAITQASTPVWDRLRANCPHAQLNASEGAVGLPDGQMGNSEVGHMNLGAGRVVQQDLPRIDAAIADGSLGELAAFRDMITALRDSGGTCHMLGVVSPGGVHSHQDHMAAMANTLSRAGIPVAIHAFLDGRDTPPKSAGGYMDRFLTDIAQTENVSIATLSGRFFALDRDKRWDRVEKAHAAIVRGQGVQASDAGSAIAAAYLAGVSDEFVEPAVIGDYAGIRDGDGLLMANYRSDRAREILSAIVDPAFSGFDSGPVVSFASLVGMVEYSNDLNRFFSAMLAPVELNNILGQVISDAGMRQLRIAETEKYAHVTFFLNGGREETYENEDRILIPSPKVATYDLCPEMSAVEVTDNLVRVIDEGLYDLIVVNYANGDMVGHTGVMSAAITAAQTLDQCLGRLEQAIRQAGGTMLVTADHGNCENMSDGNGGAHTAHTLNLVPVVLVNAPVGTQGLDDGGLCDIAPTLLQMLGIAQPAEMSGRSLIKDDGVCNAAAE